MSGSIGGFDFSNDSDPEFDPDMGSIPEGADTSFDIDAFERAASEQPEAASTSQPSAPKTRKKKTVPAPGQKKIPSFRIPLDKDRWAVTLKSSYVSRDPIKYGATASIEIDGVLYESSFIGDEIDRKETKEGAILELKSKLKKLGIQVPKNFGRQRRSRKSLRQYTFKNILPKVFQEDQPIDDPIPEAPTPTPTQPQTPSPSGSGAGLPPTQPPAPPSPPDDYSDIPPGEYPEEPKKPDIINQISSVPTDKDIKKAESENLASVKKQFKDFIREEKDKFAREFRDEKLALNREVQKLNAEAVSRKTEINRASSEAKTAIYSLSAGVGLPGYIIASIADAAIIQPAVREDVKSEQAYQRDLKEFKNQEVDILNARKDAFREYIKSNEFADLPQDVKDSYAQTGEIPEGAIPSFEEWADKTGASSTFKGKSPVAPTAPGPAKSTAMTAALGKAGPVVSAVVEGVKLADTVIGHQGELARSTISSSLDKNGVSAITTKASDFVKSTDTLYQLTGIRLPTTAMFDEAAKTFKGAVEQFEKVAREDLGFSPASLEADVEGSIMRLEQSMRIAQDTDPQKAAVIRVTDEINLVWNEFRALFFSAFAPILVSILTIIKTILQAMLKILQAIKNLVKLIWDILVEMMFYIPGLQPMYYLMKAIEKSLAKDNNKIPTNIDQAIRDFHNPANRPARPPKPGNAR